MFFMKHDVEGSNLFKSYMKNVFMALTTVNSKMVNMSDAFLFLEGKWGLYLIFPAWIIKIFDLCSVKLIIRYLVFYRLWLNTITYFMISYLFQLFLS